MTNSTITPQIIVITLPAPTPQITGQKTKKPDKPLYSVREKQNKNDETVKFPGSAFQSSATKSEKHEDNFETPKVKSNAESFLSLANEKEALILEDDISNVSTAISDRHKWDDDNLNSNSKSDNKSEAKDKLTPTNTEDISGRSSIVPSAGIEILLSNGASSELIKIYDNEDDYEALLDKICVDNQIKGAFSLHLKIYILKNMKDAKVFDTRKIDQLYNKLLDINFKVICYNMTRENYDDTISPYVSESFEKNSLPSILLEENKP